MTIEGTCTTVSACERSKRAGRAAGVTECATSSSRSNVGECASARVGVICVAAVSSSKGHALPNECTSECATGRGVHVEAHPRLDKEKGPRSAPDERKKRTKRKKKK